METQILDIPVLWPNYFEDCQLCIERLKEAIAELDGMHSVTINSDGKTLEVVYDKEILTFEEIKERAKYVGVTIEEQYKHEKIRIVGLDCPDCAQKIETSVKRMDGVAWDSLNFAGSLLTVEYEPSKIKLVDIKNKIRGFGYDIEEKKPEVAEQRKTKTMRSARMSLTVASGLLLILGFIAPYFVKNHNLADILFIASAVCGGIFSARSGILSLRSLSMDTNFLMTVAALGAIVLKQYYEAAMVMFLYSLGSTLEAYTVEKTRKSIKTLIDALPANALVKRDGQIFDVPISEIEIGEIVIIKPGEKICVDGTIVMGDSSVNEAPITGEPISKDKHKGDCVYAGSINGNGSIEVRTFNNAEDNTIARIVAMVEEAQTHKAPSQRFSETFGHYYTPSVIGIAAIVAIFCPVVIGGQFNHWIYKALTLLVVSCPCALVLSTPVAIVAAIGNAAKNGVLMKGGASLETLGEVDVVAFDKTGTLTTGKPEVIDIIPFNGYSKSDIISIASAIESRSEHPLADAIINKAAAMKVSSRSVAFFEAFPGKGASAIIDANLYHIGSKRFLLEKSVEISSQQDMSSNQNNGATLIYLADERQLIGIICALDTIKQSSYEAIKNLKNTGIKTTVMLTGDSEQTGCSVARDLNIKVYYAELLPQDKLEKIKNYTKQHQKIAMVGDGINDAPALAAANVGIAMGGIGSQAAIEAADIALMSDDISMLPYAVKLSKKAKKIIIQNITFALLVVIFLVFGALVNKVSLTTGVIGHEGSALLVIANSMRLLKNRNGVI